jgi:hypothetical protein
MLPGGAWRTQRVLVSCRPCSGRRSARPESGSRRAGRLDDHLARGRPGRPCRPWIYRCRSGRVVARGGSTDGDMVRYSMWRCAGKPGRRPGSCAPWNTRRGVPVHQRDPTLKFRGVRSDVCAVGAAPLSARRSRLVSVGGLGRSQTAVVSACVAGSLPSQEWSTRVAAVDSRRILAAGARGSVPREQMDPSSSTEPPDILAQAPAGAILSRQSCSDRARRAARQAVTGFLFEVAPMVIASHTVVMLVAHGQSSTDTRSRE